jgi:hypothetical protein
MQHIDAWPYVIAAYAIFWGVLGIYMFLSGFACRRAERALETLRKQGRGE